MISTKIYKTRIIISNVSAIIIINFGIIRSFIGFDDLHTRELLIVAGFMLSLIVISFTFFYSITAIANLEDKQLEKFYKLNMEMHLQ